MVFYACVCIHSGARGDSEAYAESRLYAGSSPAAYRKVCFMVEICCSSNTKNGTRKRARTFY
ncbi:MAG: hypothetical protein E7603_02720 [Ruminococcaceae bacterium]|nr:hypothetical protein [Oscillospiraceae bacterium]